MTRTLVLRLLCSLALIVATSRRADAQAADQITMYTFRGGVGGYDALCDGFIRQQLGWLDERTGEPRNIPLPQRIRVLTEIRGGSVVVGLLEIDAGFQSNPAGATVANGRAYDLNRVNLTDAYN